MFSRKFCEKCGNCIISFSIFNGLTKYFPMISSESRFFIVAHWQTFRENIDCSVESTVLLIMIDSADKFHEIFFKKKRFFVKWIYMQSHLLFLANAPYIFEVFNRYPSTFHIKFLCPMATKLGQNVVLVTHLMKMVLGSMWLIVQVIIFSCISITIIIIYLLA